MHIQGQRTLIKWLKDIAFLPKKKQKKGAVLGTYKCPGSSMCH